MASRIPSIAERAWAAIRTISPWVGYEEKALRAERQIRCEIARQRLISVRQDFVHRGRYRSGVAIVCIVCAVFLWGFVFTIGKSISAEPFQLLMNIVSVRVAPAVVKSTVKDPLPFAEFSTLTPADSIAARPPLLSAGNSFEAAAAILREKRAEPVDTTRLSYFMNYFGLTKAWSQWLLHAYVVLYHLFIPTC